MENQITIKPIYDLLSGHNFLIPDYQRGYRWTKDEVKALLNDLYDFYFKKKADGEFYCLQPIVVIKRKYEDDIYWELIDGQQRLTTIYIILDILNKMKAEEFRRPIYTLRYQTREGSEKFLTNINIKEKDDNIDYYFMYEASVTVKEWIKEPHIDRYIEYLVPVLLNETKFIWYEVNEENINPIDIFTRINIGKIPLTNAELVKALLLQNENFDSAKVDLKQIQIASEWDAIEKALQEDSFWYFIYNPKNPLKYNNRIEYIFDLMKNKKRDDEYYYTYNKYNEDCVESKIKTGGPGKPGKPDIDSIWKDIKKYFLCFEGWYRDSVLYHHIGYLIECGNNVCELKSASDLNTKTEFKLYLVNEIKKHVNCQLDDLFYGDSRIKKLLLLFNIQTILATEKANMWFPFNKYKDEEWDIEHVSSQTDKQININTRKDWIKDILEYFTGVNGYSDNIISPSELTEKEMQHNAISTLHDDNVIKIYCKELIKLLDADKIEEQTFEKMYEKIICHFKERDVDDKDHISNLALLDATTNRSYKNAMFPIKRKQIIENDMNGIFIPICTKNLFLKFYSKKMGDVMNWNQKDADDYISAIKSTLKIFLPPQDESHDQ